MTDQFSAGSFHLDLNEDELTIVVIDDVVLDPGGARIPDPGILSLMALDGPGDVNHLPSGRHPPDHEVVGAFPMVIRFSRLDAGRIEVRATRLPSRGTSLRSGRPSKHGTRPGRFSPWRGWRGMVPDMAVRPS